MEKRLLAIGKENMIRTVTLASTEQSMVDEVGEYNEVFQQRSEAEQQRHA